MWNETKHIQYLLNRSSRKKTERRKRLSIYIRIVQIVNDVIFQINQAQIEYGGV